MGVVLVSFFFFIQLDFQRHYTINWICPMFMRRSLLSVLTCESLSFH